MIKYFDTTTFNQIRNIKEENNQKDELVNLCQNIIDKMNRGKEFQNELTILKEKFPELFI
jgi:hypothetical protein